MTDTWRTLPGGAAAGLSGTENDQNAELAPQGGSAISETLSGGSGEYCREWVTKHGAHTRCDAPAILILWGKLFDPDALGPRCYDHASKWLNGRMSARDLEQWAVYDLRPADRLRAELAAASTRFATALDEQQARLEQARKERRDALAKVARVEAVIAPMHEDWCRAKHDPGRECECIHAEIRAAIDGSET